jgi:hypothetical protein
MGTFVNGVDQTALAVALGALADAAATGAVTSADTLMQYNKQLVTNSRRETHFLDFWSDIDDLVTLTSSGTDTALPAVTVAGIPSGAVVTKVIAMMKFGGTEDTSTAENKLVVDAAEHIQVDKTGGTYIDAIALINNALLTGASGTRGGDVWIGALDISAEVDGDDTYEFQWEDADVTGDSLLVRDLQTGLRVYFTLE